MKNRSLILVLALLCAVVLTSATSAWAKKSKTDNDDVRHPLQVIRAEVNQDQVGAMQSKKMDCIVWLKNISNDSVRNIKMSLKMRDGSRQLRSIDKEVDDLDAGKRIFVHFKWEEYDDRRRITPQIWVTYDNDNGKPVTFQAQPPVW